MSTIVTKIHPLDPRVIDEFNGRIQSFIVPVAGTSFAAIVPKGDHLSVVIAGNTVSTRQLLQFLELPRVKRLLNFEHTLGSAFRGAFPNGRARHYFGDRFAMVGDATEWLRASSVYEALPVGKARVVLAHGSTQSFVGGGDEEDHDTYTNLLDLSRLPGGEIDYIADVIHWHGNRSRLRPRMEAVLTQLRDSFEWCDFEIHGTGRSEPFVLEFWRRRQS